jgi:hypothetical protein
MSKSFWTSDRLLSLSAVLISVCTLIVFLYQTNLIRKQQYMSVFPYVNLGHSGSFTENYTLILQNNGIGPAIIKSVEVESSDGEKYADIVEYVADNVTENDSADYFFANLFAGRLIPEKETIELLGINDANLETAIKLRELLDEEVVSIKIIYESIYGEQWTLTNSKGIPIKN